MSTHDIANDLVALCKEGKFDEAGEKYWAQDVLSVEAMPGDMAEIRGIDGVRVRRHPPSAAPPPTAPRLRRPRRAC